MSYAEDSQNKCPPGLSRVAAKSRMDRKATFSNLLHHLTPELVRSCIASTPKQTAVGVDGLTRDQTLANLDLLLKPAMTAIHKENYRAAPVRRVEIPKADGGKRPLGVPTVLDRGLQAATAKILEQIFESDFLSCSYGFRPERGCHNALATLSNGLYEEKMVHALEVDIRDFFGSLDHGWLRKFLSHRISDERILQLIDSWLKAGVMQNGKWSSTEQGSVQGGSISPLLANVYLHYVLDLWFERRMKPQLQGKARLVRYCDDFVILFESRSDADAFLPLLKERLQQFGLKIAEEKTHRTDVTLDPKREKHTRRCLTFLGFDIFRAKARSPGKTKIVFRTNKKRLARAVNSMREAMKRILHWRLEDQGKMINWILRGHNNYYGMPGNMNRLQTMTWLTLRQWRKCLTSRSQKDRTTWESINSYLQSYAIVSPKLHVRYTDLRTYVML